MPFQPLLHAQDEFMKVHRAATIRFLWGRLAHHQVHLCAFEETKRTLHLTLTGPRTLQEVPLERIVGSVGRADDYTRNFLPRRVSDEARWVRVRQAVDAEGLPPLELYRVGESYFVQDGHHRVSVLRSLNTRMAEAYVTEVRAGV